MSRYERQFDTRNFLKPFCTWSREKEVRGESQLLQELTVHTDISGIRVLALVICDGFLCLQRTWEQEAGGRVLIVKYSGGVNEAKRYLSYTGRKSLIMWKETVPVEPIVIGQK